MKNVPHKAAAHWKQTTSNCIGEASVAGYTEAVEELKKRGSSVSGLTAAFEAAAQISKAAMIALLGLEMALQKLCPDRRVVHLANRARKRRIRKKNARRALNILEKEAEQ